MPPKTAVKSVRTGPILDALCEDDVQLDMTSLRKIGKIMVECVVAEARKDFAKRGKSGLSDPKGLPDSQGKHVRPSFFDSFEYRITGQKTLTIVSTWPWIEGLVEGRPAGPMLKHTQNNPSLRGRPIPFLQGNGKVLFRMAPIASGKMWIHPGIAKHTFLQRGLAKARQKLVQDGKMMQIILDQIKRTATK
jgi:hypothetical protein